MTSRSPRFSFGIPVRNGEEFVARALESLAAQEFGDIEVVIGDNASTDETSEICREYARRDERFRYMRNERNVGQIENFNAVCRNSRGTYFRWIGADDWLAPSYAAQCVKKFDAHPDAVVVTTDWVFFGMDPDGRPRGGMGLESPDPLLRLVGFFRSFQAGKTFFDPIYSAIRAEVLKSTPLLQITPTADVLLALELSLRGSFRHVDAELARRRFDPRSKQVRSRDYHASLRDAGPVRLGTRYRMYDSCLEQVPLSRLQRRLGRAIVWSFWCRAIMQRQARFVRRGRDHLANWVPWIGP